VLAVYVGEAGSLRCRSAVMRVRCSRQRVGSRRGISMITPGYSADLVGCVRVAASLVGVARIGQEGKQAAARLGGLRPAAE
jgi:hypothetical protein